MADRYTRDEAASRAGLEPDYLDRLARIGFFTGEGGYSDGDVRRAQLARSLESAGIPLDAVGAALEKGALSIDFLDTPAYERFAAMSSETFRQVHERTGIPLELLTVIRESLGLAPPDPDDRLREDELEIIPFIQLQVESGFKASSIERLLRVLGDVTRRASEQEAAWWQAEVIEPAIAAGKGAEEIANPAFAEKITPLSDRSFIAMYRAQQTRAWTSNIILGFEQMMEKAGIHTTLERVPAICFLDISGYTRLTQEIGDDAAADLAATVARLVQRSSVQHGGKAIKWLGDGVMFYFGVPGPGVLAALEMADALPAAGLPPVHVGLHAGPVLFQEGDYFGQTVNLSARIADYARPGEVLVTRSVAEASGDTGVRFDEVGPVELKGVAGAVPLLRAQLA
jgi:class 3 adenylate cyclase/DNA-binding transcriptional MerR regulator